VAVAFSGGRDSTALLHVTLAQAAPLGLRVAALHVNHGLQPQADAWERELRQRCAAWARRGAALEFHARRLAGSPQPGESVEAWARRGRHAALADMARACSASLLLLAQHRRDQAETFLLQALRGGGARGLSAMPRQIERDGLVWARPWLTQPREAIDAYVRRHRLRHVEDESNSDPRFARNRLRLAVWPALTGAFADTEAALTAAASRAQAEAACLDEIAAEDLARIADEDSLQVAAWRALSPARRTNALRAWLRRCTGRGASEALVSRLLQELPRAGTSARWPGDGGDWACYRGRLRWQPAAPPPTAEDREPAVLDFPISAPGDFAVPLWQGRLKVEAVPQGGVALARLAHARLQARGGGEQFQRAPRSLPRALKKQYQAAGIAAWERKGPLLYCEGELVFVPGLGIDARALAPAGVAQVKLHWLPDARARAPGPRESP
jgi:tRNA(Ile)-lysidine synthase